MKNGTWNVVKAKMTCKQRRHILRRAATGPKYHQGYNTYCNIDVPLAFIQFRKYCDSQCLGDTRLTQQQMEKTLTPVPSPTQASDTDPLRSLKMY